MSDTAKVAFCYKLINQKIICLFSLHFHLIDLSFDSFGVNPVEKFQTKIKNEISYFVPRRRHQCRTNKGSEWILWRSRTLDLSFLRMTSTWRRCCYRRWRFASTSVVDRRKSDSRQICQVSFLEYQKRASLVPQKPSNLFKSGHFV